MGQTRWATLVEDDDLHGRRWPKSRPRHLMRDKRGGTTRHLGTPLTWLRPEADSYSLLFSDHAGHPEIAHGCRRNDERTWFRSDPRETLLLTPYAAWRRLSL